MIWLGIIIGFCLGVIGTSNVYDKKIKKANDLEELKKMI